MAQCSASPTPVRPYENGCALQKKALSKRYTSVRPYQDPRGDFSALTANVEDLRLYV
jgi:hypothetical protein